MQELLGLLNRALNALINADTQHGIMLLRFIAIVCMTKLALAGLSPQ